MTVARRELGDGCSKSDWMRLIVKSSRNEATSEVKERPGNVLSSTSLYQRHFTKITSPTQPKHRNIDDHHVWSSARHLLRAIPAVRRSLRRKKMGRVYQSRSAQHGKLHNATILADQDAPRVDRRRKTQLVQSRGRSSSSSSLSARRSELTHISVLQGRDREDLQGDDATRG
jgi:hypothetical protein